jgi:hypothetical protein
VSESNCGEWCPVTTGCCAVLAKRIPPEHVKPIRVIDMDAVEEFEYGKEVCRDGICGDEVMRR